jgi:hypothetical protein
VAGVTPRQIYQALINAGASTTQAIGIMANMIAESGLNPEAVGDQGTSFGLVQQHGGQYSTLVTGNPPADMNAQVKVVARNGGFAAADGANGAQAAGNFSARYERCTTCQPGQSSYNQRVANAATVAGWVSSGKWPTSVGSATAAAAGGGSTSNSSDPTCAWGFSGSLVVTSVNICIVKKTTLRHLVGGLVMVAGGSVVLVGAVILAASAFQRSGAQRAVSNAVGLVPTPAAQTASRAIASPRAAAGQRVRRQAGEKRAAERKSAAETRAAERKSAAETRAAERKSAAETRQQPPKGKHAKPPKKVAA